MYENFHVKLTQHIAAYEKGIQDREIGNRKERDISAIRDAGTTPLSHSRDETPKYKLESNFKPKDLQAGFNLHDLTPWKMNWEMFYKISKLQHMEGDLHKTLIL